jgi:hypothetical protein
VEEINLKNLLENVVANQNIIINKKTERTTAVSRNGEACDLFEIGKVFNLKF